MLPRRTPTWLGFGGLVTMLGACQLVSGLSGYRESGSSTGGAASSVTGTTASSVTGTTASSGTGGATASSGTGGATASSGTGGAASSTASSGGAGGATTTATSASSGTGGCPAGALSCGSLCPVDDPTNCGWCQHACDNGTTCTKQVCPAVAVSGSPAAFPITAVTASPALQGVYWADGTTFSNLYGMDKQGTSITAGPFSYAVSGLALSTGADFVFYTALPGYFQWNLALGTGTLIQPIASLVAVGSVAVAEAGHVAWAGKIGSTWTIFHTPTAGGAVTTLGSDGPQVTADSVNIYWITGQKFFKLNSALPVAGSAVGAVLPSTPSYIAADDGAMGTGHLYALSTGGVLSQVPKVGGAVINAASVTIVAGRGLVAAPITMADPATVYWLDGGTDTVNCTTATGTLMRLTWGGAPVVVADNLTCPRNLAADKHHLYFSAGGPGSYTVLSVAR